MITMSNIEWCRGNFTLKVDSLTIRRGEVLGIVGPNGSGKSSLLDLLGLMGPPTRGEFKFDGEALSNRGVSNLGPRRRISYLMQNPYLFSMSVLDNAAYGLKIRKISQKESRKRVEEILEKLSLTELKECKVSKLSGGEAQRVALARNLVLDADLYLLDEPTANVDRQNVHEVEALIRSAAEERNAAVVITTHSRDQAYRLSDRLISMIGGRVHDLPYENVFSGGVRQKDSMSTLSLAEDVDIKLGSGVSGTVTVAVDPGDILLSTKPIHSSALNHFKGKVSRVESYNTSLQVFVDTGVIFCSLITNRSYQNLGINIGKEVWVTFKANAVKIIG